MKMILKINRFNIKPKINHYYLIQINKYSSNKQIKFRNSNRVIKVNKILLKNNRKCSLTKILNKTPNKIPIKILKIKIPKIKMKL